MKELTSFVGAVLEHIARGIFFKADGKGLPTSLSPALFVLMVLAVLMAAAVHGAGNIITFPFFLLFIALYFPVPYVAVICLITTGVDATSILASGVIQPGSMIYTVWEFAAFWHATRYLRKMV